MPMSTILGFLVLRARIAASKFMVAPRQVGVLWCSLSISPSKPTSSQYSYSSRYSLYWRAPICGSKLLLEKVSRTASLALPLTASSV